MKLLAHLSITSSMDWVIVILLTILWAAFLSWAIYKVVNIFLRGLRGEKPKHSRR